MAKILFTIIAFLFSAVNINAETEKGDTGSSDKIVVIPIRTPKPIFTGPRTPDVSTGIDAYYQNGVIYLQFSWDLGCMDVSVTNHATGEQWLDAVCSDSGAEAVCISTSAGNYTIELTTDDGTTYSGTFVL